MSETIANAQLEILYNLDLIVKELKSDTLSRTRILRTLGLSKEQADAALEYGYDNKFLKWSVGNFYTVNRPFVIPEDSFYHVVKDGINKLWSANF